MKTPEGIAAALAEIRECARSIEGSLSDREIDFLALLAATASAEGEILEIGSLKGRSTVVLARGAALSGRPGVVAVDPLTERSVAPHRVGPRAAPGLPVIEDFRSNLERAGVAGSVEFHRRPSTELAVEWRRPIRLLWIDGDHDHESVKRDFRSFAAHLAGGAFVALHDVLHPVEGPLRVFAEEVLDSEWFGQCGMCGSIGWARRLPEGEGAAPFGPRKQDLRRGLDRLIPFLAGGRKLAGLARIRYKFLRSRIPHAGVDPDAWVRHLTRDNF